MDVGEGLPYQDTAYSWVILAASVGLELLYASGVGTIGVLIVQLTETFNVKKSALTWVGGLLLFSGFLLGFIPSLLIKKYGCRPIGICASILASGSFLMSAFAQSVHTLYISHGVLTSIALCTFFNIASISGQQYFHRRRSLAAGVTMASISIGILIWPLTCQFLIDTYGWRGAFIIMSGVQLHGLVFSSLMRPIPKTTKGEVSSEKANEGQKVTNGLEQNGTSICLTDQTKIDQSSCEPVETKVVKSKCDLVKKTIGAACKPIALTPHYLLYLIAYFLIQTGHIVALSMLPSLGRSLGLSKTLGASLLSILGGTSGVSRVMFGFVGDWKRVNRSVVAGTSGIVSGLITCGMGYLTSYTVLVGVTVVLSFTSAAYNSLQGACVIDYVGRDQMAPGVGLLSIAMGFGRLTAMLVSGAVLDLLGSPQYVFVLFGLVEAGGGMLLQVLVLITRWRQKRKNTDLT